MEIVNTHREIGDTTSGLGARVSSISLPVSPLNYPTLTPSTWKRHLVYSSRSQLPNPRSAGSQCVGLVESLANLAGSLWDSPSPGLSSEPRGVYSSHYKTRNIYSSSTDEPEYTT